MERNLALYPWLQVCQNGLFWMPVFFLYFASVVPLEQVLLLEALYYACVVALEVPSGYFSDRVGRRVTLLIASGAWSLAGVLFMVGGHFAVLAAGQVLLAVGMAFFSGTDTALLYDSLLALGRAQEFGTREAKAHSRGYLALGFATAVGGALAGFELRVAYALFAGVAAAGCVVVWRMQEPPAGEGEALAPTGQFWHVLTRLRAPGLDWLFATAIAMTVLVHVPYEFLQPYLDLLLSQHQPAGYALAPPAGGALMAGMMVLSAVASSMAIALRDRLGLGRTLLLALGVECLIIAAMGAVLHPATLAVVLLRSAPLAVMKPVAGAAIHPRLASRIRATYFSVQSLAGRLAFSATLAAASWAVAGAAVSYPVLQQMLWGYAAVGLLLMIGLAASAGRLARLEPVRQDAAD